MPDSEMIGFDILLALSFTFPPDTPVVSARSFSSALWLIFPFCNNERAVAAGLAVFSLNPSFQLEGHLEHKNPGAGPEFN